MTHSPESPFTCLRGVVLDWAGTAVDFGCQGPVRAFMDGFATESVPVAAAEAREPIHFSLSQISTLLETPIITTSDRINLKSQLSKYVSLATVFSSGTNPEIEIVAYDPEDTHKIIK